MEHRLSLEYTGMDLPQVLRCLACSRELRCGRNDGSMANASLEMADGFGANICSSRVSGSRGVLGERVIMRFDCKSKHPGANICAG